MLAGVRRMNERPSVKLFSSESSNASMHTTTNRQCDCSAGSKPKWSGLDDAGLLTLHEHASTVSAAKCGVHFDTSGLNWGGTRWSTS